MHFVGPVFSIGESSNQLVALTLYGATAVVKVQVGEEHIGNVVAVKAILLQGAVQYKDKTIVYMSDLLPSAGHIPMPYIMAYDMFPLTTLQEKKELSGGGRIQQLHPVL